MANTYGYILDVRTPLLFHKDVMAIDIDLDHRNCDFSNWINKVIVTKDLNYIT